MPELAVKDFSEALGIRVEDFPRETRQYIQTHDFRYCVATGSERETLLLRAVRALFSDLSISGPERLPSWEKGWQENLHDFLASGLDPKCLIPKFVRKNECIRFRGDYVMPADPGFETSFVTVMRQVLFTHYFAGFDKVLEFGAGTGHNLLTLGEQDRSRELVGLDWARSSCQIIEKLAEVYALNLTAIRFDLFHPDENLPLDDSCAVYTIGALEQLGTAFGPFLDFLLAKNVGICLNMETLYELYEQDSLFDYVAAKYLEKRRYLQGYLNRLRELETEGRIEILEARRTFGSFFHDGYSFVVWRPRN